MAYGDYAPENSASILTQVAFKEARAHIDAGSVDLMTPEGKAAFEEVFSFLQESLVAAEKAAVAAARPASQPRSNSAPQRRSPAQAAQRLKDEFGATEAGAPNHPLTVGEDELPLWVVEQAREKGIEKVWDNRHKATPENNQPLFREVVPRGSNKRAWGFWPDSKAA